MTQSRKGNFFALPHKIKNLLEVSDLVSASQDLEGMLDRGLSNAFF